MKVTFNEKGQLSITDLNVAEAQVVYNALRDYNREYYRKCTNETYNENHHALAEKVFDMYHEEYCSELRPSQYK